MLCKRRFDSRWIHAVACGALLALASCGGGSGGDNSNEALPPASAPTVGILSVLAGEVGGIGSVDGLPGRLYGPRGLATDATGNVYVADEYNYTIRKISPAGMITLAGMPGQSGSQDGVGASASFAHPSALTVDAGGNVYVIDGLFGQTIRKITAAGQVTTLAGGSSGYADGVGSAARFNGATAIAVDNFGNAYVCEAENQVIRKITVGGTVTTLAGTPGQAGFADGSGNVAKFRGPRGIAIGANGDILVADTSNRVIRSVSPAGVVTTLTGIPPVDSSETPVSVDGPPGLAKFFGPGPMTNDGQGNLLVLDADSRLRKISPAGVVTTLGVRSASTLIPGYTGIAADSAGNIFVSDYYANLVFRISPEGAMVVIAGAPASSAAFVDGAGATARFSKPRGIGVDPGGNVYVADIGNNAIRRISPLGVVTTVATNVGATSALGLALEPNFQLTVDRAGNVVVTDAVSHLVRRLLPDGSLVVIGGRQWPDGELHPVGVKSGAFILGNSMPSAIVGDGIGSFYLVDGNAIRKVTFAGGDSIVPCGPDGKCAIAPYPGLGSGIVLAASGYLYVINSHAILKISPFVPVSVLAGSLDLENERFVDGTGPAARFFSPSALAMDEAGNTYVADTRNNAVRKVSPFGVVTTIAGQRGSFGVQSGVLPASLTAPDGIAVSLDGKTIYVTSENAVLKIQQ